MSHHQTLSAKLHPILVRTVAYALTAIFKENQYADKVIEKALRSNPKAGSHDRAFIAETTYEIVRYYRLYEAVFGKAPQNADDFWQIIGIHLIKNGRSLPDWVEWQGLDLNAIREELREANAVLKMRESIPDWMDEIGSAELGNVWADTVHALNRQAEVVLRTNTLKISRVDLKNKLYTEGIIARQQGAGDALVLEKRQNVFITQAFRDGCFEVQDFSSQLVAPFLAPEPGMRVVDACAGGGGKALHLAALMQNKGSLITLDTLDWKLHALKLRARRAGISNIETRHIDTTKVIKRLHNMADRLLLDVPCSGLGVLRRNPDSKWKLSPEFIDRIKVTQQEIIQSYSPICKVGGKMVYATCSVLPSENQQQVEIFLASEPGKNFKLIEDKKILPQENGFDGFYMALLERLT
jgi:16S rRNA (cytosine967-C5)-methyltransferase